MVRIICLWLLGQREKLIALQPPLLRQFSLLSQGITAPSRVVLPLCKLLSLLLLPRGPSRCGPIRLNLLRKTVPAQEAAVDGVQEDGVIGSLSLLGLELYFEVGVRKSNIDYLQFCRFS